MVGDARAFLRFNKEEIFKDLLAVEGHLRNVKPGYKSQDLACIAKHLADAEGHADEAISHAAELGDDEASRKFRELRDRLRDLRRDLQESKISLEEAIRRVREVRRYFEGFNPEFDVSKCRACGEVEEVLAKLKIPLTSLRDLEEEVAHKMLEHLASKYGVPKPEIRFIDECPTEPVKFGLYSREGDKHVITLCRGGLSAHVLAHEFKHYLDSLAGRPLSEEEAESFAFEEANGNSRGKALYSEARYKILGERMAWREIGLIYGSQHLAKGVDRALGELDRFAGKATAAVQERPSTWVVAGLSIGLPLLLAFKKIKGPLDKLLAIVGGYLSTKIWDYIEEYMAGGGGATYSPVSYVPATPVAPVAPAEKPVEAEKPVTERVHAERVY